jgi:hypothetical protein
MVYGMILVAKMMSDDDSPLEQNDRQVKLYMHISFLVRHKVTIVPLPVSYFRG